MIIKVDTEIMRVMATMAQDALSEIEESAVLLSGVTEHNDWNCYERDSINEQILRVKTANKKLNEMIYAFASKIQAVAEQFDAFEAALPNGVQGVEGAFSDVLSIESQTVSVSTSPIFQDHVGEVSKNVHIDGGVENFELGHMTETLKICNYEAVNFGEILKES